MVININKTILIVEDEKELADMYGLALKSAGFKVDFLEEGTAVLDFVKNNRPDLVLLDLVIPGIDGYEVLSKLKKNKETKNVLVYVWSNLTQKNEIERAQKLGTDGYLIKSDYTPSKLVEKVKEIMEIGNKK